MRFWDSSAVVPLLVNEPSSAELKRHAGHPRDIVVWWGTFVECTAAITRARNQGRIKREQLATFLSLLATLSAAWSEVQPTTAVRRTAQRLLRVHPLRAADALQLAAAIAWADGNAGLEFVTRDQRLAEAAEQEGFVVL